MQTTNDKDVERGNTLEDWDFDQICLVRAPERCTKVIVNAHEQDNRDMRV